MLSHNSRGYDAQLLLGRFLKFEWALDVVMDSLKILSMTVEHLTSFYSLNFIPVPLKSIAKSFGLSCKKGYYPHFSIIFTVWIMCSRTSLRRIKGQITYAAKNASPLV
jgi:hypothetical protein